MGGLGRGGCLTLHGFFQYGAQTEKLQQLLASEKGIHSEVRFHDSLAQIWNAGPGDYLALQRRQTTCKQSLSTRPAPHPQP